MSVLPTDAAERGKFPLADGCLFYFPAALLGVSQCSMAGNEQHNPGQDLHWDMDKSTDHANKILRHLMDTGTDDVDGIPHSVKVAWRALALAQEDLMARKGAPMPPNGRKSAPVPPSHTGLEHMSLEGVQDFVTPDCPACGCVADGMCLCEYPILHGLIGN